MGVNSSRPSHATEDRVTTARARRVGVKSGGWRGLRAALLVSSALLGSSAFIVSCSSTAPPADAPIDGGPGDLIVLDASRAVLLPGTDGASACPPGICNYQTGVGCPADTPSCVPLPNAQGTAVTPACSPAGGLQPNEACHEWSECGAGSVCVAGRCRKLCCAGDYSACPRNEHCVRSFQLDLGAAGVVATGADLCFPVGTCDVLADTCNAQEPHTACQIADATGVTACLPAGSRGPGDRCDQGAPCLPGFTCVEQWCRRFCSAVSGGANPRCPAAEGRCVHFQNDPPGVGECTPI